jgi:hypothetical protein
LREVLTRDGEHIVCPELGTRYPVAAFRAAFWPVASESRFRLAGKREFLCRALAAR